VVVQGDVVAQEDVIAQEDVVHGSKRCGGSLAQRSRLLSYGYSGYSGSDNS
jgi:hypothetical protein